MVRGPQKTVHDECTSFLRVKGKYTTTSSCLANVGHTQNQRRAVHHEPLLMTASSICGTYNLVQIRGLYVMLLSQCGALCTTECTHSWVTSIARQWSVAYMQ